MTFVDIPTGQFAAQTRFTTNPDDLVYFLLNVGDADAQVLLLPEDTVGNQTRRRAIVVDAGARNKVIDLLDDLASEGYMGQDGGAYGPGSIPLVVATHPHLDHIAGIADILKKYRGAVAEFWDPGYYHTSGEYSNMMTEIAMSPHLLYAQPTSGLRRWFGNVGVTVLSPSIQLRNLFDSYGVEVNDSSISLKIDYPAARVVQRDAQTLEWLGGRVVVQSLILGADAQTLSWSFVLTDYPYLGASQSAAAKALRAATGADPLRAKVLKVSHHASKRGVNLELVERIAPQIMLVSTDRMSQRYYFPHDIAREILREAVDHIAGSGTARTKQDWELKLFYTCDQIDAQTPLGTTAVVFGANNSTPEVWRFLDGKSDKVKLNQARRML